VLPLLQFTVPVQFFAETVAVAPGQRVLAEVSISIFLGSMGGVQVFLSIVKFLNTVLTGLPVQLLVE
jgi:hypothetical protein